MRLYIPCSAIIVYHTLCYNFENLIYQYVDLCFLQVSYMAKAPPQQLGVGETTVYSSSQRRAKVLWRGGGSIPPADYPPNIDLTMHATLPHCHMEEVISYWGGLAANTVWLP